MLRVLLPTLLALAIVGPSSAHAQAMPEDPPLVVDRSDPHRFSPLTQGAVGAAAFASGLVGVALLINAHAVYEPLASGSQGSSCRPCSDADLVNVRAQEYAGIAALGLGAVLLATDIALIALDRKHRSESRRAATRLSVAPGRLAAAWRF